MAAAEAIPPDANMLIAPPEPTPGALGAFAKYAKLNQIKQLEEQRVLKQWEVRAYISDHIPLAGDADAVLLRPVYHLFHLNENPLWIYLHSGGRNAVYYGLFGDETGKLKYITVGVESKLPANALLLARRPINALLDVFTRDSNMPLTVQRLDLMSPIDGDVLNFSTLDPSAKWRIAWPVGWNHAGCSFCPL
jgi:hypothetical protein